MAFEIKNNKLIKYINEPEVRKVIIPDGIEIIAKYAFFGCNNVESIHIPASVRLIYGKVFENCPELMEFSVDEHNKNFLASNGYLYEASEDKFMQLVKVPEGIDHVKIVNVSWRLSAFSKYSKFSNLIICDFSGKRLHLKRSELDQNGEYSPTLMYNINQLIHELDTSVHISHAVKTSIMMQMYFNEWSGFHDIPNFSKVFKGIIDREETETIRKILDEGKLITKRNINTYIKYADENGHYSVFDMLNDYKEEVLKI